jgi:DNA-binding NarL/FixJ family response regulator
MPMSPAARFLIEPSDRSPIMSARAGSDQSGADTIRVAIAHGQQLVRAGLRALLERESGITVVDEAADGDDAVAMARRLRPDVVLLDVRVPGLDCVEATRRILAESSLAVMVLSATEADARVFATLKAGAAGVLFEDREPAALVRALRLHALGGRGRAHRSRRAQPAREVHMLTPKVIEIRRGSAHAEKPVPVKSGSRRVR